MGWREEEGRGCSLEEHWYCWLVKSCRINDGSNTELVFHSFLSHGVFLKFCLCLGLFSWKSTEILSSISEVSQTPDGWARVRGRHKDGKPRGDSQNTAEAWQGLRAGGGDGNGHVPMRTGQVLPPSSEGHAGVTALALGHILQGQPCRSAVHGLLCTVKFTKL